MKQKGTDLLMCTIQGAVLVVLLTAKAESAGADTLEGELGGESRSWHVLRDGQTSTARFSNVAPGVVVYQVQGHAEEKFAIAESVALSFTAMNGRLIGTPEVSYFPENSLFPVYSNQGGGKLTLEHLKSGEDTVVLKGRYQGSLERLEGIGKDASGGDSLTLDLFFDVRLRPGDEQE
ncbi:hypothetical protein ACRYJU_03345 [Alloalcanivorax xenomutans]|uniref:Uncharacterized protein n=2 Tax=Alcanivoracaceae TaxID=224372 RepID=A0A9Q3W1C2_9GAMM|nr:MULTISPECIES: hypothetical protein [Alcanivoracaceae]KYZ86762.1 hypothetical protein A3Q32_15875 [Alcanivorax sp. KX64203]KAF0807622.1 hypothetical protein A6D6_00619 [Alcanivorax xiamenensis]MCE7507219.1 hypothetical protein [Alloalcanivorax xenomutans]MCE7524151.1 hypothetical protein [Alloalcanivorax xenomutans]WOA32294.1 hypothetical protein RVY87_04270 [Alloalcanivorax xenomutans]